MAELKITDFAKRGYHRMLLAEGKDDGNFAYSLLGEMGLRDKIYLYAVGGKHQFKPALTALLQSAEFEELTHLAIIRDSDFDTDAVSSVQQALESANTHNPRRQFPIPDKAEHFVGGELKVAFFVLPQSGVEGILENLLLDALTDDSIMACVNAYLKCLEDTGIALKQHIVPKAKIRIFLAGNAIDYKNTHEDSEVWELQYMFQLERWKWNHSAFDPIKNFLRQLAE